MPTWEQICARRLGRHGLLAPFESDSKSDDAATGIRRAVEAMCGAHAQVLSAAEVSIGVRLTTVTRADIAEALWVSQTLIKSYGPRGTVHLLPAAGLPMWSGALSSIPRRSGLSATDRLNPAQLDDTVDAIADALGDGVPLTIAELDAAVVERTGDWAAEPTTPDFGGLAPRWRQALSPAAYQGRLCFGPSRGRNVTYARPPRFDPIDPDDAVRQLVTAYLHAYGPATPADFAKWLAAPGDWAERAFAGFEPTEHGHVVPGDTEWPGPPAPELRLLPYFDPYAIGAQPRDQVFAGADRALSHGQAGVYPVLLIGGAVRGLWHQRRSGRKLAVTVEPFGTLTKAQRGQLDVQLARLGEITEATVDASLGEVAVQAHR